MANSDSIQVPSNVKDETGNPYGKLTVLRYAGNNVKALKGAYWVCRCECGRETTVCGRALRNGSIQTCGCSKQRMDETGKVYGKLTIVEFAGNTKSGDSQWLCRCECGNTTIVPRGSFRKDYGGTRSCGCGRESAGGGYKTPEYNSWKEMKARCYNPNDTGYHWYGGREGNNIRICEHWRHSFPNFLADMGKKPSTDHSIERKDNDGNYSCGHCDECVAKGWTANCKWATTLEQGQNTRKTRLLTYNGETHGLREWARRLGITHYTLSRRIASGWPLEKVFSSEHYFTPPPKKVARKK